MAKIVFGCIERVARVISDVVASAKHEVNICRELRQHIVYAQFFGNKFVTAVFVFLNLAVIGVQTDVPIQSFVLVLSRKVVFKEQIVARIFAAVVVCKLWRAFLILIILFRVERIFLFAVKPGFALVGSQNVFKQFVSCRKVSAFVDYIVVAVSLQSFKLYILRGRERQQNVVHVSVSAVRAVYLLRVAFG